MLGKKKKRQESLPVGTPDIKRVKAEHSKVDPVVLTSEMTGNPLVEGKGESSFSAVPKERIDSADPRAMGMYAPRPDSDVVVA